LSPVTSDLAERASKVVAEFPECFWFWRAQPGIRNVDDVRLVVKHLREYGDRRAWQAAQGLHKSLSPHSNPTS